MADFWYALTASAFRKHGDISKTDAIRDIVQQTIRDMLEQTPAAVAVFDDKMRYLAVSRRFLSDYELGDPTQVIGHSIYETFPDMPQWREINVRVLAGDELASEEESFPRHDGRIQWVRWSMKPWRTADGLIVGEMLFAEVITDQVTARRALTDSETQFRVMFENAPIGIARIPPDGRLVKVNEAACRMVGYSADELTTRSFLDTTHPDDRAASVAGFELMRARSIAMRRKGATCIRTGRRSG
jgi:PAS domain S-box-containing protein